MTDPTLNRILNRLQNTGRLERDRRRKPTPIPSGEVQRLSDLKPMDPRDGWRLPYKYQGRYDKLLAQGKLDEAEAYWQGHAYLPKREPTANELAATKRVNDALRALARVQAGPQTLRRRV